MNYLAIDASTEACSVALTFNGKTYTRYDLCPQSHSLLLLPMVDQVLQDAGCKLQQLDGLVFGRGPGSFTGVRIGIGVAQGLAFAADLKVAGVSTLQAMAQRAYQQIGSEQVIAAIDARMSEIYTCYYKLDDNGLMAPQTEEVVIKPEQAAEFYHNIDTKNCAYVGTGWQAYNDDLVTLQADDSKVEVEFPHAENMLIIGTNIFKQGYAVSAEQAQPVYVRDTVSWKKLPGRE